MLKCWTILNWYRIIPAYLLVCLSKNRDIIWSDLQRYQSLDCLSGSRFFVFGLLMLRKPEFRTQLIYRLKCRCRFAAFLARIMFRPMNTLFINTRNIGPGLYIQHGFATIITAKSIGRNCYVNQQVTIGFEGPDAPVIGDNVRICAGAKVIGNVCVGSNSIIGANAVVVKDVPDNVTVGGVPAKVIRIHTPEGQS